MKKRTVIKISKDIELVVFYRNLYGAKYTWSVKSAGPGTGHGLVGNFKSYEDALDFAKGQAALSGVQ